MRTITNDLPAREPQPTKTTVPPGEPGGSSVEAFGGVLGGWEQANVINDYEVGAEAAAMAHQTSQQGRRPECCLVFVRRFITGVTRQLRRFAVLFGAVSHFLQWSCSPTNTE